MPNATFTKFPVGNRLFVIEWDLSVNNSEQGGDVFEALDCELLSVTSLTLTSSGTPPVCTLRFTNQSDAPTNPGVASNYVASLVDEGAGNILPWAAFDMPLPPPTRYIFPRLENTAGQSTSKISCLFKTIC